MQSALDAILIDRLLELYCSWREECVMVEAAYGRFSTAARADRPLAFSAYMAALDREESAATTYAQQISRVASNVRRQANAAARVRSPCARDGERTSALWRQS